ncbi:MAG: class II aldolase/adducin family protein [Acidobacteria bacterium]|nr:class II aldolase/adducin family protein [Acidobacteriota bacterium]
MSVRLAGGLVVCTRHRADNGKLSPNGLIMSEHQGNKLTGEWRPTSEMAMHLAGYQVRADVGALIHAHPPTATGFTGASTPLYQLNLPEPVLWLGPVGFVPYAAPGSNQLAESVSQHVATHETLLRESQGVLTVGSDLLQAAERMELVEHCARATLVTRQLGRVFRLSSGEIEELLVIRRRYRHPITPWWKQVKFYSPEL